MPGTFVRLDGSERVVRYLTGVRDTARTAGRTRLTAGTSKAYAYGIETGRTRGGRLARKAGGAFMLRDALIEVRPKVGPAVASALLSGRPQNVGLAFGNLGRMLEAAIRRRTPVGKRPNPKRLRDSYVVGVR